MSYLPPPPPPEDILTGASRVPVPRIAGEVIDVLTELKLISMQPPLARKSVPNSAVWYDTRGVFPMMAYTGRLRPKGVPFSVSGYIIG